MQKHLHLKASKAMAEYLQASENVHRHLKRQSRYKEPSVYEEEGLGSVQSLFLGLKHPRPEIWKYEVFYCCVSDKWGEKIWN
jgi:hypothetical protein